MAPKSKPRALEPALRRTRSRSDKREAIVAAALDLFVDRGFYGTAVPDIAERAKVGAGTIYRYFDSKEALVNELYRQEKARFAHMVIQDFPGGNTREQFRATWMRMARYAIAHPTSFVFLELHYHARYLDAESRAVEQRMLDLFSNFISAAQARGELRTGPPMLLMGLILGAFVGVIRCCLESGQSLDRADWQLAETCIWEAVCTS